MAAQARAHRLGGGEVMIVNVELRSPLITIHSQPWTEIA
eukprot:COSAG01_NODE_59254_length_301_cov_0.886139_1_plen_38_part_10